MGQPDKRTGDEQDGILGGGDLSAQPVDLNAIQGEARERMLAQPLNPFVRLEIKLLPRLKHPALQQS
jgi:hypothetical protein